MATDSRIRAIYCGYHDPADMRIRMQRGRYEHPINFERRFIEQTYKALESSFPYQSHGSHDPFGLPRVTIKTKLPRSTHYYPTSYRGSHAKTSNNINNTSSFFQPTATSASKGYFVVHPDFVSEGSRYKLNLKHLTAAKGEDRLRYGSRRSGV